MAHESLSTSAHWRNGRGRNETHTIAVRIPLSGGAPGGHRYDQEEVLVAGVDEDLVEEFGLVALLAFAEGDVDESVVAAVDRAVAELRGRRSWTIGPPDFVDDEEADVRTVGAQLLLLRPASPTGRLLPAIVDRAHLDEVRTFVGALQRVSKTNAIDIGFELDGEAVGWIDQGLPDDSLTTGLIGEWEAKLHARGEGWWGL